MNDNSAQSGLTSDMQFFLSNPTRRYHVRDAAEDDLSIPDVPTQHPQQGDRLVMEKVQDPDSDLGFSIQHKVYFGRDQVDDTDEAISKLLRSAQ